MVSPYRHVPSLEELDDPTLLEMMTLVRSSMAAIRGAYGPDGFNIGVNFMPVIADARVLPQSLEDSYRELTGCWPGHAA